MRLLVLGPVATQRTALEPSLKLTLSLSLPAPAALAATLSTQTEYRCSSRPLDARQEQQQRRKRRVEQWTSPSGGWSA